MVGKEVKLLPDETSANGSRFRIPHMAFYLEINWFGGDEGD